MDKTKIEQEYKPDLIFKLAREIPFIFKGLTDFAEGEITWDKMLIKIYQEIHSHIDWDQTRSFAPSVIEGFRTIFKPPLDLHDQAILIMMIIEGLKMIQSQGRRNIETSSINGEIPHITITRDPNHDSRR